jgi:hypothetical protein
MNKSFHISHFAIIYKKGSLTISGAKPSEK